MSGRANSLPPRLRQTAATIALSVLAFVTAIVAVFLVVMWGESGPRDWGILVGVLGPIGVTLIAAAFLAGHFVRRRIARTAHVREIVERELHALFKTDLN